MIDEGERYKRRSCVQNKGVRIRANSLLQSGEQ
jgi:hypothetical protein